VKTSTTDTWLLQMVQFPPYLKLIVSNPSRKGEPVRQRTSQPPASPSTPPRRDDVVSLVSTENRRAVSTDIPTALEAEQALRRLQEDLPHLNQDELGEVHSKLDRRIILSLLAPLVM